MTGAPTAMVWRRVLAEKKKRVHHLAKELLVTSKTIIEKCRAEGIELKNHMHVVSAGLEATIREWFSEGAHTTTLEESERIVLTAVRVKPKRKKKVATPAAPAEAETTPAAQESEAEVAAKKEEAPETPASTSPQPVTEEPPVKVAAEVAVQAANTPHANSRHVPRPLGRRTTRSTTDRSLRRRRLHLTDGRFVGFRRFRARLRILVRGALVRTLRIGG